jgi:hypothetical protein
VLRLGCVLVLVLASLATAAPEGKVVRVERVRKVETTPIICSLRQGANERYCFGPSPRPGDIVTVVDDKQLLAEYRVDSVKPASKSCEVMWQIEGELVRGQLTSSSDTVGLIDASADPRTLRQISRGDLRAPVPDPGVRPVIGLDRNGDGDADIVITQASCAQAGNHGRGECFDFWVKRDKGMKSVFSANLQACFQ